MAGKTSGGSKKKPTAKKTTTARTAKAKQGKSPARGRTVKKTQSKTIDKTPIYVLAIMALLTVVVVMLIKDYKTGDKKDNIASQETAKPEKKKEGNGKKELSGKAEDSAKETTGADAQKEKSVEKAVQDKQDKKDKKEIAQSQYYIYLVRFNEKTEKMSLSPVKRTVKAESPIMGTLNELIKGPNRNEKKKGLLTAVPEDLKIRDVKIDGRNVVLDFNDAIETNANGEILLTRIDQLVYTATQFDGIDSIIIKVNGKQKKFLGGEGLSVSGPIGRKGR